MQEENDSERRTLSSLSDTIQIEIPQGDLGSPNSVQKVRQIRVLSWKVELDALDLRSFLQFNTHSYTRE